MERLNHVSRIIDLVSGGGRIQNQCELSLPLMAEPALVVFCPRPLPWHLHTAGFLLCL